MIKTPHIFVLAGQNALIHYCLALSVGTLFGSYRLALVALLSINCSIALAEKGLPEAFAGFWKATTYYNKGSNSEERETARLEIKFLNNEVTAISTTGAVWKGFYDQEHKVLRMQYRRDVAHGTVILKLSKDETVLTGEWSNNIGESGRYLATKE